MDERRGYICKADVRDELLARRALLADKSVKSAAAAKNVLPMLYGNVLAYASIGSELDTTGLITELLKRSDVTVFVPHTYGGIITPKRLLALGAPDKRGNLAPECYGEEAAHIDVCVTPLVGFNAKGYRIGYGKGCYDRFFAAHRDVKKVGLAFDCQLAEFEPEEHDVPLDCCITESKVIYF